MGPARKLPDQTTYSGRCAERFKALREKAGLTPQAVADRIGVTWRTVYHWESGASTPSLEHLPILAELFGLKSPRSVLPEK